LTRKTQKMTAMLAPGESPAKAVLSAKLQKPHVGKEADLQRFLSVFE
jgi:hypothetical protein